MPLPPPIVAGLSDAVRARGGKPFLVPCIPIRSNAEVIRIGKIGMPVYFNRFGLKANGIIVVNHVKPHTSFRARFESGLMSTQTRHCPCLQPVRGSRIPVQWPWTLPCTCLLRLTSSLAFKSDLHPGGRSSVAGRMAGPCVDDGGVGPDVWLHNDLRLDGPYFSFIAFAFIPPVVVPLGICSEPLLVRLPLMLMRVLHLL